jgi:hypothetical protein
LETVVCISETYIKMPDYLGADQRTTDKREDDKPIQGNFLDAFPILLLILLRHFSLVMMA